MDITSLEIVFITIITGTGNNLQHIEAFNLTKRHKQIKNMLPAHPTMAVADQL